MIVFLMFTMFFPDYEVEGKKIEPSIYSTVNERHREPFQPRQYIRKVEKKEDGLQFAR
ncbi:MULTISPECIES: hypothetical protein [Anoxybacillus]|uniref:Uncharacterized protein n=1 Tax=Anoxybacillus ayderensis TaxID=265546 RepID=A0A0D0HQG6_9BACL|nr:MULTISPECIES: hypothetical protein [Anoxybacillus]EPZ37636.1 hypothetical protein C289_2318 [Anoxybacillus ayderensis]KIP22329.1 hypothetical protein JV16_00009 [Anoxybacillus ayderensis]